jgi:IS5 family transposase
MYFLQSWYALSDPMAEDSLHGSEDMRRFAPIERVENRIPNKSTTLNVRHLLEKYQPAEKLFAEGNAYVEEHPSPPTHGSSSAPCVYGGAGRMSLLA